MMNKTLKIAAFGLLSVFTGNTFAQVRHHLYPYADGVVADNNGHDLVNFIKSNKKETAYKSGKINDFSNGKWGYLQVSNARVPSVNIQPVPREKNVDLNFEEYIDATLALYNTKDGVKATWWARQANKKDGAFFSKTAGYKNPDADIVRYEMLMSEMRTKDFTIVDYNDSVYNDNDYDKLLKNYIIVDNEAVKDFNDYKALIDFFNGFLGKFSYVEDPLLENKSFITCVAVNNTKYIGYFNIRHNKLGGHMQVANIQFESDKDVIINNVLKQLTGKTIYVYGDDIFGMESKLLKYGYTHPNLKLLRRKTDAAEKFNAKD